MKHMNLKKLAGITAAAALSLTPMLSLADATHSALVKGGALNLRESASLSAKVLGQYPTGAGGDRRERRHLAQGGSGRQDRLHDGEVPER